MSNANFAELATSLAQLAQQLAQPAEPEQPAPTPPPERLMLTPTEAGERLAVGRTTIYKLIRSGELESVQIGRLRRVPASAVQEYAHRLLNSNPNQKAA